MSEAGRASCTKPTSPHRVKDSKERTNEGGGVIHNFQVATSEGPQMLPNWTKRLGSGGRWRELGAVEGGGINGIKARDS